MRVPHTPKFLGAVVLAHPDCALSLALLGPSVLYCNLVNTMRQGAPPFSLSMALEEAFKAWENSNLGPLLLTSSEWSTVRT